MQNIEQLGVFIKSKNKKTPKLNLNKKTPNQQTNQKNPKRKETLTKAKK